MTRATRILTALVLASAVTMSLTACLPSLGGGSGQQSAPSSRDQLVAEIKQALEETNQFDGVVVEKGNLTVGWDLWVSVSTDEPLTGNQLDLMMRTTGDRISGTNISSVTFVHTPPGAVLPDSIGAAARELGFGDRLPDTGKDLTLSRNEVINYAQAQATEG